MRAHVVGGARIVVYSRRRIRVGEELTIDYRYPADLAPIPCLCGETACRGIINLQQHA